LLLLGRRFFRREPNDPHGKRGGLLQILMEGRWGYKILLYNTRNRRSNLRAPKISLRNRCWAPYL
jgi:hypothetical protein